MASQHWGARLLLTAVLGCSMLVGCGSDKEQAQEASRAAEQKAAFDSYLDDYERRKVSSEQGSVRASNPNARLRSSDANESVANDFDQWAKGIELESATKGVLEKPYLPDPAQLGGVSWQRLKRMAETAKAQNPMLTDPKLMETLRQKDGEKNSSQ